MSTASPIRLRPDNFTPPVRTPWGGARILQHYKCGLPLDPDRAAFPVVGESWEVSVDPAFPSVVADGGEPLGNLLRRRAADFLGRAVERYGPSTPMLVKLLDAAEPLSVQVHPADDDPHLGADESGKPECWYVLEAAPGAGLFLGLAEGVSRSGLDVALRRGDDIAAALNFVPVVPGDMFVIEPGTVHAIGAGVTLVEPQLVLPGKSGKTFRFWDWNRRYDREGRPSPTGEPRPLHLDASLAVTRFDGPRGTEAVEALRRRAVPQIDSTGAQHDHLADLDGLVVERLLGSGRVELTTERTLNALVVVAGRLVLESADWRLALRYGESCIIPAAVDRYEARLEDAEALITRMR